jgi:hypothetical protein
LELSKFQAISQHDIAKKFCRFKIREEGPRLNSARQNVIGYALARLLDLFQGDDKVVSKLTIKDVFTVYRDNFCSINGALIGRGR